MAKYTVGRNPSAYGGSSSSGGGSSSSGGGSSSSTKKKTKKKITRYRHVDKRGVVTRGTITETRTPAPEEEKQDDKTIRAQDYQKSLLERQGYTVTEGEKGELVATKGEQKVVITRTGKSATVPKSAKVEVDIIPSRAEQRFYRTQETQRREEKRNVLRKTLTKPADVTMAQLEERYERKAPVPQETIYTTSSIGFFKADRQPQAQKKGFFSAEKTFFDRRNFTEYEKEVEQFEETQQKFREGAYFQQTQKMASIVTTPSNIPKLVNPYAFFSKQKYDVTPYEERSFIGKTAQSYTKQIMDIPGGLADIVLFTPKKAQLIGKAFTYEETRGGAFKEVTIDAPKKVVSTFDPRKPEGVAAIGGVLTFSALKARADFKSGKLPPFLDRTKVTTRTTIYKSPQVRLEKTATIGKKGTVSTIKTEPVIKYTVQGKRVAPSTYAKILGSEGKIIYSESSSLPVKVGSRGIYRQPIDRTTTKPAIDISYRLTPAGKEMTIGHELTHHQIGYLNEFRIPGYEKGGIAYRYTPSEVIARTGAKIRVKSGFKVSSSRIERYKSSNYADFWVRKEGDLTFKYPRMKVLEKTSGGGRTVSVTEGTIKRGLTTSKIRTVQIGRDVYGTIRGKGRDIVFRKTPRGGIKYKELKPLSYDLRETGTPVVRTGKSPIFSEQISLKRTAFSRRGLERQVDIGKKIGTHETVYPIRTKYKTGVYRATGGSRYFKGFREIKKSFVGEATTRLAQRDMAGRQFEMVKMGKSRTITLTEPDIKYALQPTYKPNVKTYGFDIKVGGIETLEKYVRRPKLTTERITSYSATTKYVYIRDRPNPFKKLYSNIKDMGKKGELKITKKVTVKTEMPKLKLSKPGSSPTVTGPELISFFRTNVTAPVPTLFYPASVLKPTTRAVPTPKNITREESRSRSEPKIRIEPTSKIRIQPKIRIEPLSKTKATTRVRQDTRVTTKTLTSKPSFPNKPAPPMPRIFIRETPTIPPFILKPTDDLFVKKTKTSKRRSLFGEYKPQLRSAGEEIFSKKKTGILTGIGFERPIIKGL